MLPGGAFVDIFASALFVFVPFWTETRVAPHCIPAFFLLATDVRVCFAFVKVDVTLWTFPTFIAYATLFVVADTGTAVAGMFAVLSEMVTVAFGTRETIRFKFVTDFTVTPETALGGVCACMLAWRF